MDIITILALLGLASAGLTIATVTMWSRSDKRNLRLIKDQAELIKLYQQERVRLMESRDAFHALCVDGQELLKKYERAEDGTWL
jgi:hypothetical protein